MKFVSVSISKAMGHILAHSVRVTESTLKKGTVIRSKDINTLDLAGYEHVTIAMLENGDVDENSAAEKLANAFLSNGVKASAPFAGRVNLIAEVDGVVVINTNDINAFNGIDQAITIATLPNFTKVKAGTLIATLKIIPYAVHKTIMEHAKHCISPGSCQIHPFTSKTCDLILTRIEGFKHSLLAKAEKVIKTRIMPLNIHMKSCVTIPHTEQDVMGALKSATADIVLILGASATSDRQDVVPAAIDLAGGVVERYGMPVDPGNLLLLGSYNKRTVIGLPGCARSPALNGADWVLERLGANLDLNSTDIAQMGVGGLLKEIPNRTQPRMLQARKKTETTAIVLAAGNSSRMLGEDKLLRVVNGEPLLRHSVKVVLASNVDNCLVVLKQGSVQHRNILKDLPVKIVETNEANFGMSASLRAGVLALDSEPNTIVIALADMPDLTPNHFNRVIAEHNEAENKLIVCPITPDGKRGHPVLFNVRFKENLASLDGDVGAKEILQSTPEAIHEIELDQAVTVDLDTPKAWVTWESSK